MELNEINMAKTNKSNSDIVTANDDVIFDFPVFTRFEALWMPDSGRIQYNSLCFIHHFSSGRKQ